MLASGPIAGILVGWAAGGRLSRLGELHVRWWPLLAAAVALRVSAGAAGELAVLLYVAAFSAIATVAVANSAVRGMWLIAAGAVLNLVVVAVNGAMPVDPAALQVAGGAMPSDRLHIPLSDDARLSLLADRIPVPPFRGVYSVGDLLLTAGGFLVPFTVMRRR